MFVLDPTTIATAHTDAAAALAACRIGDWKGTYHAKPCSELDPCRGCRLDAAAAVAATLLAVQEKLCEVVDLTALPADVPEQRHAGVDVTVG